jgi:hypothetical protein
MPTMWARWASVTGCSPAATSFLIEKKDAQERGMTILPAARNAQIGPDDVTPSGWGVAIQLRLGSRVQP